MRHWLPSLAVAALTGLPAVAQDAAQGSRDDGGFLERQIESLLSGAGREVVVTGFAGALSSAATLDTLTIADDQGVWLTLRNVELDWNRSALLRGRLEVTQLTAEEIRLPRLPQGGEDLPSPEAKPFSLPDLPVSVEIGQIAADSVFLGQPILGEEATVSLVGGASLSGGEGTANLAIQRIDGQDGSLTLAGSYENATQALTLDLQLSEPPDGIAANALNLPGLPSVDLVVDGSGTLADFTADIDLATGGEERLAGEVRLIAEPTGDGTPPDRRFEANLGGDLAPVFSPRFEPFFGNQIQLQARGTRFADGRLELGQFGLEARSIALSGEVVIGADGAPRLIDVTGEIAEPGGGPVLLPVGEDVRVDSLGLDIDFDADEGPEWTAAFTLRGLETAGASVDDLGLTGTGEIVIGAGPEAVNAVLDFAAAGVNLADPGAQQALGQEVTGRARIAWEKGQPVTLDALTVEGENFALSGDGRLTTTGDTGPVAQFSGQARADRLAAFSGVAGRPLGGAAALDVDLSAGLTSRSFSVEASGQTTDLAIGQEQFDRIFAGDATLRLDARRDQTGTFLDVLDITSDAASLTATARLTSDDSVANLTLRVEDAARIDPSLSGPATADVTASGAPDTGFDIEAAIAVLGADLTWTGRLDGLEGDAPLVSGDLDLSGLDLARLAGIVERPLSGTLGADLSGRVSTDLARFDLSGTVTGRDLTTGIADIDAALRGRSRVALDASRTGADAAIEVAELDISSDTLVANASGTYDPGRSAVDLTAQVPDLSAFGRGLSGPARITAEASESAEGWAIDAEAAAFGATLSYEGRLADLDTEAPLVTGDLSLSRLDLDRLAGLVDRPLDGVLSADLTGEVRADLSRFDVAGTVMGQDLRTGIPEADAALRGQARIALDVNQNSPGGPIEVAELNISSDTLTAHASGTYDPGRSVLSLTARSDDLTPFGRGLSGPARITAEASESAEGWAIDAEAAAFGATLSYEGRLADLDTEAPLVTGDLSLSRLDLDRLAGLVDRPLDGVLSADLTGEVRADLSRFDVAGTVMGQDLRTGIPEADAALSGQARIALDVNQNGPGAPIEVAELDISSDTLTARASGTYDPGRSVLSLTARSDDLTPFGRGLSGPARITAEASESAEGWAIDAEAAALGATFAFDGRVAELDSAAPLVAGNASLRDLNLARLAGIAGRPLSGTVSARLEGQARTDQSSFDLTADVSGQGIATGIPDLDTILRGSLSAQVDASKAGAGQPIRIAGLDLSTAALTAEASGTYGAGQSDLTLSARLADISPFVPEIAGPVSARGRIGQANGDISVDLTADGPGGIRVAVTGTAAPDFGDANLSISGNAPLAAANRAIAPQSLRGTATFDLSLNGRPGLPALSGTISTSGARLVVPNPPTVLNDIDATVWLGGQTARIEATAEKQAGGGLSVAGTVGLDGSLPVDLTVQLTDIVVADPALYRTTASGTLALTGAVRTGARAAGTIVLGPTEIRVPSSGLGLTGPIPDLVHLNQPAPVRATRARAGLLDGGNNGADGGAGAGPAVALDIQVIAENRIFVRGRGLDAELGGRLSIGGTTADVVPAGRFELIRGRLDILGKRLDLTEGSITLQGDFGPYLRLVARTDANDTVLLIVLEGPVQSPTITFSSQPELPEDEVLAQLLFGRSITDISPLQAARLASAVATLTGRGGDGIVGRLRSQFGLDDLDITTDDAGNAAVRAGAYLSENIYSNVTVTATGETTIDLNLDLTPSLTARGSVTTDGETSLGIFFERDY